MTRGYDLELELPYREIDGVRYCLGTAGSLILACPNCGEEHFRGSIDFPERCFTCRTEMVPLTFDNREIFIGVWRAAGDTITTVEQRRADRLAREARIAASRLGGTS